MSSTYSTSLRIELQGTGENSGTWGTITNNNFSQALEFSIAGVVEVACGDNAVTTLTNADGPQSQANNQARNAHIRLTGAHGAVRIAQFPATQKIYLIENATTDSGSSGPYAMTCRLGASGNTISIANGTTRLVSTDGTNWFDVFSVAGSLNLKGQDLVLDSDGDTKIISSTDDRIEFSIAGTGVGNFTNSSSDFVITSGVQDKDIIFKGDDAGSPVTALTLDMSEAGNASFGGTVTANAGLIADNITIDGTEIDLSSGDLTLDVAGDIILDAGGNDVKIDSGGTTIAHFTNSSSDFVIETKVADKDFIIKGLDDSTVITAVTFDMSAAGKATFNDDVVAFSDERLKTNIQTIPSALDKVLQMRGVNFEKNGHKSMGVIAQEVQKVIPEVVSTENKDGEEYLGVAYPNMVGVLIEAIKDLQSQVNELKKG